MTSTSNNAIFFLHYRYLQQLIFHFWPISVIYTLGYFWCINYYGWPLMKDCGLSIFIMSSKIASLLYFTMENIIDTSFFGSETENKIHHFAQNISTCLLNDREVKMMLLLNSHLKYFDQLKYNNTTCTFKFRKVFLKRTQKIFMGKKTDD